MLMQVRQPDQILNTTDRVQFAIVELLAGVNDLEKSNFVPLQLLFPSFYSQRSSLLILYPLNLADLFIRHPVSYRSFLCIT